MAKYIPSGLIEVPLFTKRTGNFVITLAGGAEDFLTITFPEKYKFGWLYYSFQCDVDSHLNPYIVSYWRDVFIDSDGYIYAARIYFWNGNTATRSGSGSYVWIGAKK